LPDEVAVSVVTMAELELGVLMATDPLTWARRLRTLMDMKALAAALPLDERVASAYALLASTVLSAGRRPRVQDTWIAATALANGAEVWTQDADFTDFAASVPIVRL
jgi:predicted nucleic acid-binding protein